jgi:hypothetical protein
VGLQRETEVVAALLDATQPPLTSRGATGLMMELSRQGAGLACMQVRLPALTSAQLLALRYGERLRAVNILSRLTFSTASNGRGCEQ